MIVIGVDAHKLTHTLVAVDANGRIIGERVVEARPSGHSEAIGWARASYGGDVTWGVEDCRQVSAGLERALLAEGEKVLRLCRLADYADRGVTVLVDGGDRGRVVGIIPAL